MLYLNDLLDLDSMEFKEASRVSQEMLAAGSLMDLPGDNLAGFNGPHGFFSYAQQRLSDDGRWLLIASLAGGVKIAVENLDVAAPIGLICVQGEDWRWRESRVSRLGRAWAPMEVNSLGNMRAKKIEGGFNPISRTRVIRGMDGVRYEYWAILPSNPDSVKNKNGKACLTCGGVEFILDDQQQAAAALSGKMTWIVPDESGDFIFPLYF